MRVPTFTCLTAVCLTAAFATGAAAAEGEHQLEAIKGLPKGLSDKVAAQLNEEGHRITGPNGVICEIWLAKEVAPKADFKPTLFVKYPFTPGQLMGAIRLPTAGAAIDFRGQELQTGTYTLRYGQQPQDGNHLGTSDVLDFLLACDAAADKDPAPIADIKQLFKLSAKVAGSTHPSIFLLMPPPEKTFAKTELVHNEDKDWWVIHVNIPAAEKKSLPLVIVAAGQSEA